MAPNNRNENRDPNTHSARDASQGEIILRTPLRKAVFLGALVIMVLLVLALGVMAVAF